MRITKYVSTLVLAVVLCGLTLVQGAASEPPSVKSAVSPIYPVIAQAAKQSGDVVVDVEIDKAGKVSSARVVTGQDLLRKVSVEAARRWEFLPDQGSETRKARLAFSFQIVSERASALDRSPVFHPPYRVEVKSGNLVTTTNY
jgi:TonB family protein